jgi:hypothetical protein
MSSGILYRVALVWTDVSEEYTAAKTFQEIALKSLETFNLPNLSSHNNALGLPQSPTEVSTRHLPSSKARPGRKADNLTAIFEHIF